MNKKTSILGLALAAAALASVFPAQAQKKMYRCGSNYQDRPCEQTPATPKPAAPAAVKAESTPAAPTSRAAYQQQLRCENHGRQVDELREKQKGMKANLMDPQIKSLETRMKGDNC